MEGVFEKEEKNKIIKNTDKSNISNNPQISLNIPHNELNFTVNTKNLKYYSIDEIIDKGGYNILTFKIIFITILFIFTEGFYLSYFGFILSAFQSFYNCSDIFLQIISGLNFLGMGIGSMLTGFLTRIFSRKKVIFSGMFSMFILHFIMCFVKNIYVFTITRFLIALCLGLLMIIQFNILTEYLPVKLRSFMLNAVWLSWGLGAIYFLLWCKVFIPNLEYDKKNSSKNQDFYMAILQIYIILLLMIFSSYFFLCDSPRNLILNEDFVEAKKILNFYTNDQITDEEFEMIKVNLISEGENKYYQKNLGVGEIFNERIKTLTILMMIIFFFLSFGFFGLNTVVADVLKVLYTEKHSEEKMLVKKNTIDSLIIINLTGSLGTILGGICSEIKGLGRKRTEIYFFSASIFFACISLIFLREFNLFIGISLGFFQSGFNIHITYTEEIYPTKIRDFSIGFLLGITRIGGFISQFAYIHIIKLFFLYPVYFYISASLIIVVLLCFLPNDNRKALDSYIKLRSKRQRENSEKVE